MRAIRAHRVLVAGVVAATAALAGSAAAAGPPEAVVDTYVATEIQAWPAKTPAEVTVTTRAEVRADGGVTVGTAMFYPADGAVLAPLFDGGQAFCRMVGACTRLTEVDKAADGKVRTFEATLEPGGKGKRRSVTGRLLGERLDELGAAGAKAPYLMRFSVERTAAGHVFRIVSGSRVFRDMEMTVQRMPAGHLTTLVAGTARFHLAGKADAGERLLLGKLFGRASAHLLDAALRDAATAPPAGGAPR